MLTDLLGDIAIHPGKKLTGKVEGLFQTIREDDFQTRAVLTLSLGLGGISGDRHGGFTRFSGGREPYYPRETEMCNERQLSLLSREELAEVADAMGLESLKSEWIGGNIVVSGLKNFSMLPPRTRLVFSSGAVVRVDGDNAPCRVAGQAIAANNPGHEGLDLLFPKVARYKRGLVGYVEKAGAIDTDDEVIAHIPPQWIYPV